MCLHGLPSYCCAICNHALMERPDGFRRRAEVAPEVRFDHKADTHMRVAAQASLTKFRATDRPRSQWRQEIEERNYQDFCKRLWARL